MSETDASCIRINEMNINPIISSDIQRITESGLYEKMSGKTLLITGATGMLGAYLSMSAGMANRAMNYGIKLILACRDTHKARSMYDDLDCCFLFHDLRSPLDINIPIDYIMHTAGPVGPVVFQNNPADVLAVNTIGTLSLLEYAVNHGCEGVVFSSTHEVYGRAEGECTESMASGPVVPMDPRSAYILGKQAAENALACYHKQYGLRAMSARLSRLYGPLMNMKSGLFVCDFIEDAVNKRPVHVRGGLNLLRPLCYIADAAEAMLRILVAGSAGEAYNVQGDELPLLGEIADIIARQGKVRILADYPDTENLNPEGHWLNTDKLKKLDWQQNTSLSDGLTRAFEYFDATKS